MTNETESQIGKIEEKEVKSESTSMVDKANEAADRLEKANVNLSKLLAKQERLRVENIVAGRTEAGIPAVEQTAEDKAIVSARDMLKGTGYDDMLFPMNPTALTKIKYNEER